MTSITDEARGTIATTTEGVVTRLMRQLNPEGTFLPPLSSFQICHHDGEGGRLFSVTILSYEYCFAVEYKTNNDIQILYLPLMKGNYPYAYLYEEMMDNIYGHPLILGPTYIHTISGVQPMGINNIDSSLLKNIKLGMASLLNKDAFQEVATGVLPRLQSITDILCSETA